MQRLVRSMGVVSRDQPVVTQGTYARAAPTVDEEGEVRMLICALDYKKTRRPLTCTIDGQNVAELAQICGVEDLCCMYDEECTKENVEARLREVGSRCGDNDYFVFYYSGHGTNVKDVSGDESDGKDEALCLVNERGKMSRDTVLLDEDLAEIICDSVPTACRILILTDCCHSGTIGDLDRECWDGREAITIAGCLDEETSGDIGNGGIFTNSMLLAIEKLSESEKEDYSVGLLYNATLKEDENVFASKQHIMMSCAPAVTPDAMAWPLIPLEDYTSPMGRKARGGIANIATGVMANVANLAAASGADDLGDAFVSKLEVPANLLDVPVCFLTLVCVYLAIVIAAACVAATVGDLRMRYVVLATVPCFCIFLCMKGKRPTKRMFRDIEVGGMSRPR